MSPLSNNQRKHPFQKLRWIVRPAIERMERRITPANATLVSGVLTVDYSATGTAAESVTIANDGTNIALSGNVSGSVSNLVASVSKIVVTDSGGSTNQSLTFSGTTGFSLSDGLSSTNVETVVTDRAITATSSGAISVVGKSITCNAALTTSGGNITLTAANGITLHDAVTTGGGGLSLDAVSDDDGNGSLTLAAATMSTWVQQQQLTASDGAINDFLGFSVAMSADGNTAIVGAPYNSIVGFAHGTAYVFTRAGALWTEQALLLASDNAGEDYFGIAVSLSADGNTAIVGAHRDDIGAIADQGSAYVFTRSGSVWSEQAKLKASDGAVNDYFGDAVALSADGNTAIVSAHLDDIGANTDQGTAYVYTRSGSVWTEQVQLKASDGASGDNFGQSVALSADGNTAIVGADLDDIGFNTDQGSAYVFTRSGSVWSQQAQLKASDGAIIDSLGYSVALSVDGNTAIVGTGNDDIGGNTNQGSAYVFTRSGSVWGQQAQLKASDGTSGDALGISVALSADGNTAIVGATGDNISAKSNQGSAYVFTRSGSLWVQKQQLTAADGLAFDVFGYVAISADGNSAVVGAFGDDVAAKDQGSAYTFSLNPGKPGGSISTGSGSVTIVAAGVMNGTVTSSGTVTLQSSNGQPATITFTTTGNTAAQLVIPSNVTAVVNGSFDSSGAVQVDGTLGGTGSVGTVTVLSTGTVAPGNSPGKFTTGNIAFNSGSTFSVELNGNTAGTQYDQLVVNGTVSLGGATLSGSVGYTPAIGKVFTIINNNGTSDAVTGTFNGLVEGSATKLGAYNFKVSYQGGDGNDVTLTRVPDPPTVSGVTFGDGTNQRSLVKQMVVNFSEAVTFSPDVVSAFKLSRSASSSVPTPTGDVVLTANPPNGPASSVTITFTGSLTESGGSLIDGLYDLTIDASKITGAGGNLDGDGIGGAGGNYSVIGTAANKYFRYFGDYDGDGSLSQSPDFIEFRNAFGPPSAIFDFDNDGSVDQDDFIKFRNNFGGGP